MSQYNNCIEKPYGIKMVLQLAKMMVQMQLNMNTIHNDLLWALTFWCCSSILPRLSVSQWAFHVTTALVLTNAVHAMHLGVTWVHAAYAYAWRAGSEKGGKITGAYGPLRDPQKPEVELISPSGVFLNQLYLYLLLYVHLFSLLSAIPLKRLLGTKS